MNEAEAKIIILSERYDNMNLQICRFVSHLESEQRVTGNISKRVDMCEKMILNLEKNQELVDKILRNGNGLVVRVDRIEQRNEGNRNKIALIFGIVSTLVSIVTLIIEFSK